MTQEQVNLISDDFQSTFTLRDGRLYNLFFPEEKSRVEQIIRSHVPQVKEVSFRPVEDVGGGYLIWEIEVL